MSARSFYRSEGQFTIGELAKLTDATVRRDGAPGRVITDIAALDRAGPADLVFFEHRRFASLAHDTSAGACLTTTELAELIPAHAAVLIVKDPFQAFVTAGCALYPAALRPSSLSEGGVAERASVHPGARLENGVTIDPGAVVGAGAEIGAGTVIGANAVIGSGVRIGRHCAIGCNSSIMHALIGDRVIIHPNCSIGQDGFGFVMGRESHRKVPQIGRVIIQDDVEIGAGTSIDRGGLRDTVVGEGTKIDNQVQVGHNVEIGRHCVVVSQVGIAGSVVLEDHVVLGGQVGIADNITVGEGAKIGAKSGLMSNVPAGETWIGTPAMLDRDFWSIVLAQRAMKRSRPPVGGSAKARGKTSDE